MKNERRLRLAIHGLDATEDEKNALLEILHVEGFGGMEDCATGFWVAKEIAQDRLEWLRHQREDGFR